MKKAKKSEKEFVRIQCRLDAATYRKAKVMLFNAGVSWQTYLETVVTSLIKQANKKAS